MTFPEVMSKLQSLGDPKICTQGARKAAGSNQFGVKTADLRDLAKSLKSDPEIGEELWNSGNLDAMMLATLIMKPKSIPSEKLARMVRDVPQVQAMDWLMTNIVKLHPDKEQLRETWMKATDAMSARAGWSLTTERVIKNPAGLDLNALLDRIEAEMAQAAEVPQWTMNYCLAEIGINFPEHRARALAIGEKLGVLKDFPYSKGCVSPYAPIWITEVLSRKAKA